MRQCLAQALQAANNPGMKLSLHEELRSPASWGSSLRRGDQGGGTALRPPSPATLHTLRFCSGAFLSGAVWALSPSISTPEYKPSYVVGHCIWTRKQDLLGTSPLTRQNSLVTSPHGYWKIQPFPTQPCISFTSACGAYLPPKAFPVFCPCVFGSCTWTWVRREDKSQWQEVALVCILHGLYIYHFHTSSEEMGTILPIF